LNGEMLHQAVIFHSCRRTRAEGVHKIPLDDDFVGRLRL
jgi:hypothetical protein